MTHPYVHVRSHLSLCGSQNTHLSEPDMEWRTGKFGHQHFFLPPTVILLVHLLLHLPFNNDDINRTAQRCRIDVGRDGVVHRGHEPTDVLHLGLNVCGRDARRHRYKGRGVTVTRMTDPLPLLNAVRCRLLQREGEEAAANRAS